MQPCARSRCYRNLLVFAAFGGLVSGQTPATGVRARATPSDYSVSQQTSDGTFAASLIPPDQVKHLFAVDVSKTYLVFEVAFYPSGSSSVSLNPRDFLIKSASHSEFIHPTTATSVAAYVEDKNTPRYEPHRDTQVTTAASVGYESGRDPYTGQREHGTYAAAGVGVSNEPAAPPPPVRSGPSAQDRQNLEDQLADKSLPEGAFNSPVAGYLYFAAEPLKKTKGTYDLQHLSDASGKVDLLVPTKPK